MERAELYAAVAERFHIRTALYPGSADDIAPSFSIPYVAYLDSSPLTADFFRDGDCLLRVLNSEKRYAEDCRFAFYSADYNQPPELPQFDLLISQHAGNVGQAMKRYLKPGGILLVAEGPADAELALDDPDYELIGTVKDNGGIIEIVPGVCPPEYLILPADENSGDTEPICIPIDRNYCFRKVPGTDMERQTGKTVFACDYCHFLFSRTAQPEQCPECGKHRVRLATDEEQKEFAQQLDEMKRNPL